MSDALVENLLGADGPLATAINGFRVREQQIKMAETIDRAMRKKRNLIVEAGTGTGKTFAYLIPALMSDKKVVLSTGTRNLQDQLFLRDIPVLIDALKLSSRVALLKGRANYLCRHRMKKQLHSGRFRDKEQIHQLHEIKDWSDRTRSGDIAELSDIAESAFIWPYVTSTSDNCLGTDCDDFDGCHVFAARAEAQAADLVVVNHHLFCADMALKQDGINDLLPDCDVVIFDEAHQLPETATRFFGETVSGRQIRELCIDTEAEMQEDAKDESTNVTPLLDGLQRLSTRLHQTLNTLGDRAVWSQLENIDTAEELFQRLDIEFEKLEKRLKEMSVRSKGLEQCYDRCTDLRERFKRTRQSDENHVAWYETHRNNYIFNRSPLDISHIFANLFDSTKQTIIMTSATLTVERSFDFFQTRIGLEDAVCRNWQSPFDYTTHAMLYLPQGMPAPSDSAYIDSMLEKALPVIKAAQGRTMMLFTSHRALQQAAEKLEKDDQWNLLVQGKTSKRELVTRFQQDDNAILLGAASFWEGVDIPGPALSCVIIDRLPFASPGDPVLAARIEKIRKEGKEPFNEYQLPQAVISMIQGAGRLIRSESDRGVLMIADPRILNKPYGQKFLRSLPRMPISQSPDDICNFLQAESVSTSEQEIVV